MMIKHLLKRVCQKGCDGTTVLKWNPKNEPLVEQEVIQMTKDMHQVVVTKGHKPLSTIGKEGIIISLN